MWTMGESSSASVAEIQAPEDDVSPPKDKSLEKNVRILLWCFLVPGIIIASIYSISLPNWRNQAIIFLIVSNFIIYFTSFLIYVRLRWKSKSEQRKERQKYETTRKFSMFCIVVVLPVLVVVYEYIILISTLAAGMIQLFGVFLFFTCPIFGGCNTSACLSSDFPQSEHSRVEYRRVRPTRARSARRSTPSPIPRFRLALKVKPKIKVLRGGEFLGNRFRFKVKILNESQYVITDVTVAILSYPRESLHLEAEDDDITFSKIEPDGFRSPHFDFFPKDDCVRGQIIAVVSYIDMKGEAHSLTTEPYTIRAVCDLLHPEPISPDEFQLKLQELQHGELELKVDDWTPEEMHEKTIRILDQSNFHEVTSEIQEDEGIIFAKVTGWARGKYTGKTIGVEIRITGKTETKGASCSIRVSGEDDAMILPALDDIQEKLLTWLCPMCSSNLSVEAVKQLKAGNVIKCSFCGVTIGR